MMNKKLDQEDIDALFAGANAALAAKRDETQKMPEKYIFSRAGQISNDQMRAISTVNDLFARNLMQSLGGWLRAPFRVKLVAGEQLPFAEFLERLSPSAYLCSVRLEPLSAVGLLELDLSLALPIVDVLFGGTGSGEDKRELTDIEEAIMVTVVELVINELSLAWQPVGLEFGLEKRETEAQAARTMTLGEKTLCVSFEVRMAEAQGVLNLCLPAVVLNAILRRLITEKDRPRRRSKDSVTRIRELVGKTRLNVGLQLPMMQLRASQIASLEPGAVLRLPVSRHEPFDIHIANNILGKARPMRCGDHRAALLSDPSIESITPGASGAVSV